MEFFLSHPILTDNHRNISEILSVLVSRIQQIDMAALGSDLTWIQGMKIFELALINAIKSPGKINGTPGSKSLAELFVCLFF